MGLCSSRGGPGTQNFTGNAILATDATLSEYAALLDTPYPPTSTGALTMTAFRGPIADDVRIEGVTYSLMGSNGRSFYLDDSGLPDSTLTSTQALGTGGFIELAPVTVELQVGGTAVNCTSEESWLAASSNRFLFPIRTRILDSKHDELRMTRWSAVSLLCAACITSCANTAAPRDTLYQLSVVDALLAKDYDGEFTLDELLQPWRLWARDVRSTRRRDDRARQQGLPGEGGRHRRTALAVRNHTLGRGHPAFGPILS